LSSIKFKAGLKFTKTNCDLLTSRGTHWYWLYRNTRYLKLLLTKFKIPTNIVEKLDLKLSSFLLSLAVTRTIRRNVREENNVAYFISNVSEYSRILALWRGQ